MGALSEVTKAEAGTKRNSTTCRRGEQIRGTKQNERGVLFREYEKEGGVPLPSKKKGTWVKAALKDKPHQRDCSG